MSLQDLNNAFGIFGTIMTVLIIPAFKTVWSLRKRVDKLEKTINILSKIEELKRTP